MHSAIVPATSGIFCPKIRPAVPARSLKTVAEIVKIESDDENGKLGNPTRALGVAPVASTSDVDEMEVQMLSAARKRASAAYSSKKRPAAAAPAAAEPSAAKKVKVAKVTQ